MSNRPARRPQALTALVTLAGVASCSAIAGVESKEYVDPAAVGGGAGSSGTSGAGASGGAAGGGAGVRSWCDSVSTPHQFCDDFDGQPPGGQWQSISSGATGGTLTTTGQPGDSPPNALVVTTPALATGADIHDYLQKRFSGDASSFRLDYELKIERLEFSKTSYIKPSEVAFAFADGTTYGLDLLLYQDRGELQLYTRGGQSGHATIARFALPDRSRWVGITLEGSLLPPSPTVSLRYDGTIVKSAGLNPPQTRGEPVLALGAFYASSPSQGAELEFDNVVFNFDVVDSSSPP